MADKRQLQLTDLYALLESIGRHAVKRVDLYALDGTALTILGIKSSTIDIDFNVDSEKQHRYLTTLFRDLGFEQQSTLRWRTQEGFAIDLFHGSNILGTQLLSDCLKKSKLISSFGKLMLHTLSLEDIIISKLARGDERDFGDIRQILLNEKIDVRGLVDRYKETMKASIVSQYRQKLLDLIDFKFKDWGFERDETLIREVWAWD